MNYDLQNTIALLSRTAFALNALLRDLPETWTHKNEGENTWSVLEVIRHLIHVEHTNWMPRVRTLLQFGETQPFPPFDRMGHVREIQDKSLPLLLDEFARIRSESLDELRGLRLGPEDLKRQGKHPALGTVTLGELLATWSVHDLTHLHQISRVMACQYREGVGPFNVFLGVLHCKGHGA